MVSEPQGVDGVSQKYECRAAVAMATLGRLIDSPAVRIYPGAPHEQASSKTDGERGTTQVLRFCALQSDNMFIIMMMIHYVLVNDIKCSDSHVFNTHCNSFLQIS